ncbi:MscL family protein [Candidatus Parcubacteria bacterium]|nr:MscL family protein [Patescibacteria group bacterium]MBU4309626.1 MscL family protein [Patescibacteria group bacterium]MBU4431938.1 MscL family protein [Patescibacteria group bacterium]MBU4577986.1 MscL family protein [Patescibacteria group bacterium]MCG2696505.1 MscL family protein [Candidatus Parcubacteria bacterium]
MIGAIRDKHKSLWVGLFEFLKNNAIIGMAIGVVVAQIVKDLVDSLVKGILMPSINLMIPGEGVSQLVYLVNGVEFNIGIVINSALTFLIVMTILYIVVKKILKMEDVLVKK